MSGAEAARNLSVPEITGRYRIGNQLGVGGMGTIYVAYDTLAKREVAYKRLKVGNESARPRLTALFEREYNALRQLKHPNIVEVYDYGLDNEGPYYTMELLTGKDLATLAPLLLAEACRIVRDVASALALLHARRLVHRDVTPANVRLTQDGRAKLIDFGALSEFGVAREIVGTPSFLAPESLAGEPLDGRTDLFALGGVAYWALTKRHAYPARTIGDLMDAWEVPVSAPSHYVEELPRALDEVVLSLLERDPLARPASAAHVIERLTAIGSLAPEADETQVAYSYLLHPPLVGRKQLLDQLAKFAGESAEGRGRTLMIEAASGLGRSAILDRIAIDAQLSGANVLRYQPSGKREAGLAQSIMHWMRALFPQQWREQVGKNPVLTRETRAPLSLAQSPSDVTQQRARLVAALHGCVEQMSEVAPITLLVDDLQRADAESLALLASLARTSSESRVLLVLTLEERARGADANALADLRAIATQLRLRPLEPADVKALVDAVFGTVANSYRLAQYLHAESGGTPGLCMDLCRLLLQQREIRYELGTFVLPFAPKGDALGSRTLELTRLADLSPDALALMHLLSVHDSSLSSAAAATALAYGEERVLAASEELAARGLVRREEQELALASESLRGVVRESLAKDERIALHAGMSKAILAHGESSLETRMMACHHLLSAGQDDAAIALVWDQLRTSAIPYGSIAAFVPVLERLLAVMRERGLADERLWPLLWPLVIGGFWGELGALNRHREAALSALANVTGVSLARRLAPRLGKKLALMLGLSYGLLRHVLTPKRFRGKNFPDVMSRFFSVCTMSTATASASFEPETALRIAGLLDPFEAAKEQTMARTAREFALATAELGAGFTVQASQRYQRILTLMKEHNLFSDEMRNNFIDGCVHGCAQADVSSGAPDALKMAEELSRRHPFFRPHVETIKMTFYGYRGEKDLAEAHRKQAEILALQGGLSWSAFTVLSFRTSYIAMASQDTLGVLRAMVELERLASIAPSMVVYRDLCQAYVALVRNNPSEALAIYERCAALPNAKLRPGVEMYTTYHAEALSQLGRHEEAKALCESIIALRISQGAPRYPLRAPLQQLAMIEAKLGNFSRAKEILNEVYADVVTTEAPLPIGAVRRDQARVALLERDARAFDEHFAAMLAAFRSTGNSVLIQQCRRLLAEAEKTGVVAAPNWEEHDLAQPANTQDLASQVPDVTELVENYS